MINLNDKFDWPAAGHSGWKICKSVIMSPSHKFIENFYIFVIMFVKQTLFTFYL